MPHSKEERCGRERYCLVGMAQYDKAEEGVKIYQFDPTLVPPYIYIFSRIFKNLSKAYAPSSAGAFS